MFSSSSVGVFMRAIALSAVCSSSGVALRGRVEALHGGAMHCWIGIERRFEPLG